MLLKIFEVNGLHGRDYEHHLTALLLQNRLLQKQTFTEQTFPLLIMSIMKHICCPETT